jgi:hypothetical protein
MTTTTTTAAPTYKVGDTVRVKKTGHLVELDDVNQNPYYERDEEIWAEGMRLDGVGTAYFDSPDEVEKVEVKPLPTAEDIAKEVSSRLHSGFGDVIDVHETSVSGNTIEAVGRDSQGMQVAFLVTVHQVERAMF